MDITVAFAARAIDTIRSVAASEILPRYRSVVATHKDDGSLVTEADHASQRLLVRGLSLLERVPVMGEEMARAEQERIFAAGGRFWCVDPLDGTRNFAHGVPFFAVSVALMQDARPVFGTVYDPIADEAFFAVREAGAGLATLEEDDFWATPAFTKSAVAARSPQLLAEWRGWIRAGLSEAHARRVE